MRESKFEAFKRMDKGESVNKIAMDLGVGQTTIINSNYNYLYYYFF